MQKYQMVQALADWSGQDIKLWADLDECVIGVIEFQDSFHATYSERLVLNALKNKFALDDQEAHDRLDWMIESSYGNNDPVILKEMENGI